MQLNLVMSSSQTAVPITIERGCLHHVQTMISAQWRNHAVVLIADSTIAPLYAERIIAQCIDLPRWKGMIIIPAGEQSKSRAMRDMIEDELFARGCGRDTVVIALGGGVVGDLAGFVSATFCRGIPFINIPTTLMAMTDSAIGGKTGINHPSGKNLLGAFYHPQAILIDPELLHTLSDAEYRSGLAEVVKYGCIGDRELFDLLTEAHSAVLAREPNIVVELIQKSVQQKVHVVSHDEKESGLRAILNFGHTTAHALEQLAEYTLAHGVAVYQGMVMASVLSWHKGLIQREDCERILHVIALYHADLSALHSFASETVWNICASDKKNTGGKHKFVLLASIGRALEPQVVSQEEFDIAYRQVQAMPRHILSHELHIP